MKTVIKIVEGQCRDQTGKVVDVSGKIFPLIKQYQKGKKGGFVTVDGSKEFKKNPLRVKVEGPGSYEFVSGSAEAMAVTTSDDGFDNPSESEESVMERIAERFGILDEMTKAAINSSIRAMIVVGPPGVGKSYGVEKQIEKAGLFDKMSDKRIKYEIVKGSSTAIGLYATLYKYSDAGCVLVFDDCDSILLDDVSLNLLKSALDSGKRRRIFWTADSSLLKREGIPDQFDFKGSVIFITNLKFENLRSKKLQDHLDALQSRCHYLDLTLNTMRDKYLRIKQIAKTGQLFQDYDFDNTQEQIILDFMYENRGILREMSLRMAIKIADLVKSFPEKWQSVAKVTVMKGTV